jgi:N-acyl-D-aspartate/D-glutamate deacylase
VPRVVEDLPGGGKRLSQRSVGFVATVVAGQITIRNGDPTDRRPGRLLRNRLVKQ